MPFRGRDWRGSKLKPVEWLEEFGRKIGTEKRWEGPAKTCFHQHVGSPPHVDVPHVYSPPSLTFPELGETWNPSSLGDLACPLHPACDKIPTMILPQFSIRWLFGATAAMAALSLVASFGYRGQAWAIAIWGALGALVLTFVAYAGTWLVAMGVAGILYLLRREKPHAESPFATHKPAPQVLEPRENDS